VLGKEFDVNTMEAVEGSQENGKVAQIVHKGYQLNGQVIQHAKVILK
jgi:molecular chaperone GrpE (heat shock protein)